MRITIAQLNFRIADFPGNLAKMENAIQTARRDQSDLIIFSELAVCGYPPLDLLEQKDFIDQCNTAVNHLALLANDIGIIVGAPSINPLEKGKKLLNSVFLLADQTVREVRYKTLLPTYDIFDEYRYFEPNQDFQCVTYKGFKIALTICEDIWDDQPVENAFARNRLYKTSPLEILCRENPDLIINISASPFASNKLLAREEVLLQNSLKYHRPIFYCNQVGANTEIIFDGSSMVLDAFGNIADRFDPFEESVRTYVAEDLMNKPEPGTVTAQKNLSEEYRMDMTAKALVFGIKDYFAKMGFTRAILGLSGGMDSALTLVLAVKALGNQNVLPVLMPSRYSSDHSVSDSIELCKALGIQWKKVPIDPVFSSFLELLAQDFHGLPEDLTEENLQARIRGVILMALANKLGYILLNTSNKSEAAVGYATLYGDMNGGLSVLGDVYKTDVYRLAQWVNQDHPVIPKNIFTKPPSAELRPDQKDSDSLPEYDVLDAILYRYIEQKESIKTITDAGFQASMVARVLSMVNRSEYKRFQSPPILRVTSKAFGLGRRFPLVAKY